MSASTPAHPVARHENINDGVDIEARAAWPIYRWTNLRVGVDYSIDGIEASDPRLSRAAR